MEQLERKMLQWAGCWQRSRELKSSCDPSKGSVWDNRPIRQSSFEIMTVFLLPAHTTFSAAGCEHTWGGRCQPQKEESVSSALPFLLSTVSCCEVFPNCFSSQTLCCRTPSQSASQASDTWMKRPRVHPSLCALCLLFPDMSGSSVWPDDFCIRAWLADGHWLDIHTVLNGVKRDTWIHAALFCAV